MNYKKEMLAQIVKEARNRNLGAREFSEISGISQHTAYKILTGKSNISETLLIRICTALDIPYITRHSTMVSMRRAGMTLIQIGKKYGLGRERIRQLLKGFDTTPDAKICWYCDNDFIPKYGNLGEFCSYRCAKAWDANLRRQEFFFTNIELSRNIDKCWNWRGLSYPNSYGHLVRNGETYAHRYAWRVFKGNIPNGLQVLHHCDNPPCCNPEHLWLGTHKDNMNDRDAKGRGVKEKGFLKKSEVLKIKVMLGQGKSRMSIAQQYDRTYSCISRIATGRTWKHI